MSLVFNATTSPYNGIVQKLETTIYGEEGLTRISGNSEQLGLWTTRVNLALDTVYALIFQADGRWQFDDSNHTDFPTITTDLVASQRDYAFTVDGNSNLILEIHKVYAKRDASSEFELLDPVDELELSDFYDGDDTEAAPYRYGKKANAILVDPVPPENVTNGLKVEISREGSYFSTSDTTKKAGFAGIFHEYLALRPAFNYAVENNMDIARGLQVRVNDMEREIVKYYSKRAQDERAIISPKKINHI